MTCIGCCSAMTIATLRLFHRWSGGFLFDTSNLVKKYIWRNAAWINSMATINIFQAHHMYAVSLCWPKQIRKWSFRSGFSLFSFPDPDQHRAGLGSDPICNFTGLKFFLSLFCCRLAARLFVVIWAMLRLVNLLAIFRSQAYFFNVIVDIGDRHGSAEFLFQG